jgi:hypothetical protein
MARQASRGCPETCGCAAMGGSLPVNTRVQTVVRQEPQAIHPLGSFTKAKEVVVQERIVVPVKLQEQADWWEIGVRRAHGALPWTTSAAISTPRDSTRFLPAIW